jgi:hypothetical protein
LGLFEIAWQAEFLTREMLQIFRDPDVRGDALLCAGAAPHGRAANRGKQLNDGQTFAATQVSMFLDGFNFRRFLEDCYAENARRMSVFEPDPLRPSFLP